MGFVARDAVEPLDYDFRDEDGVGPHGTIPEPTSEQIEKLFNAVRGIAVAAGVQPGASRDEAIQAFAGIPEEDQKRHSDAVLDALADFCQGSPTRAEIDALPHRPRNAFLGWLVGQFAGEAGKGDTHTSPATANGGSPAF